MPQSFWRNFLGIKTRWHTMFFGVMNIYKSQLFHGLLGVLTIAKNDSSRDQCWNREKNDVQLWCLEKSGLFELGSPPEFWWFPPVSLPKTHLETRLVGDTPDALLMNLANAYILHLACWICFWLWQTVLRQKKTPEGGGLPISFPANIFSLFLLSFAGHLVFLQKKGATFENLTRLEISFPPVFPYKFPLKTGCQGNPSSITLEPGQQVTKILAPGTWLKPMVFPWENHGTTPEMHGGCHGFDGWENHRTLGWNWMEQIRGIDWLMTPWLGDVEIFDHDDSRRFPSGTLEHWNYG